MSNNDMEKLLSQLVKMVGSIQVDLHEMRQEQQEMKREQQIMKEKLDGIEIKGEERHKEIIARFKALENDQDFIWEKTARNEREIGNIKRQLS